MAAHPGIELTGEMVLEAVSEGFFEHKTVNNER